MGRSAESLMSWIGHRTVSSAQLDPAQANRMAVTLDRKPEFSAGDLLPAGWHWLYFHDVVEGSRLGLDGHPALGVTMPPLPLPRRMWAAGRLRFARPIRLGEDATRTSVITEIVPKSGRSGDMYFVTVEHEVSAEQQVALQETQTLVYRDLASQTGGAAQAAPSDPEVTRQWSFNSTALFRYSALTFNGHRIHYDADYARSVEGYPGLVVHGPLLATLLMDLATDMGAGIATIEYRARAPLFADEPFSVNGHHDAGGARLWAASADGRVAMDATATFEQPDR